MSFRRMDTGVSSRLDLRHCAWSEHSWLYFLLLSSRRSTHVSLREKQVILELLDKINEELQRCIDCYSRRSFPNTSNYCLIIANASTNASSSHAMRLTKRLSNGLTSFGWSFQYYTKSVLRSSHYWGVRQSTSSFSRIFQWFAGIWNGEIVQRISSVQAFRDS